MKSRNGTFFFGITFVVINLIWSYTAFVRYFGENDGDRFQAMILEKKLNKEKKYRILAEVRLRDFAEEVAAAYPKDAKRQIASLPTALQSIGQTSRVPAANLDLSGIQLERAKAFFRESNYSSAMRTFEELIEKYPTSPNAIEALFLLNESAFLVKDDHKVIQTTDHLVKHFPESNFTGYALIRLAQLSEKNSQISEAIEIYDLVQKNYKEETLSKTAKLLSQRIRND